MRLAAVMSLHNLALFRTFCLLLLSTLTVPANAHHSIAGQFDMSKVVEWSGVITAMDWINPHSYIYLDVKEADGSTNSWRLESLPTSMFRKAGLSKELVMGTGQQVTIRGIPARDGTLHLGYIIRIDYADGHFYQLSAEPSR